MVLGISDRSATTWRRWAGCSASTLAVHPISRLVVSLPAPEMTSRYVSNSCRSMRRRAPVSSTNSACSRSVIRSSAGCSIR